MRVLVTGAAGSVGQCVVQGLQENHSVRGHDRVPTPHLDDHLISDLNDFTAVERAVEGWMPSSTWEDCREETTGMLSYRVTLLEPITSLKPLGNTA